MTHRNAACGVLLGLLALTACFSDHGSRGDVPRQQWWDERGPVVPHDTFPEDCSLCHLSSGWDDIKDDFSFDHLAETGRRLDGAHATAECLRCHNDRGPVARFAERGCAGCHEDIHQGELGKMCADCHTEGDWNPVGPVVAHNETRFPLVGAHAATACFRCHEGAQVGNFARTDVRCASCHQNDVAQAKSPDHIARGWISSCEDCHVPTTWGGAGFQHDQFPLVGGHAAVDCSVCHVGGVFEGTSPACASCHMADYNATFAPNHAASGFLIDCGRCHNVMGWQGASFDHPSWPLTGAHAQTDCSSCHGGGVYLGMPRDCFSCHAAEYNATSNPNHAQVQFPTSCDDCHLTSTWQGALFDHLIFPLQGAHAQADCTDCHVNGVFQGTDQDCYACHQAEYDNTTTPNHAQVGFPTNCQSCHDSFGWGNAVFDHFFIINKGPHGKIACANCHINPAQWSPPSCTHCHKKNKMDSEHKGKKNYVYASPNCINCHPRGRD